MTFHRNTTSDKGATRVTHQAKAASVGSTGSGLPGSVLGRRALATRAARSGSEGSGAPAKLLALLAISLAALFATAAPALAALAA